ncbi:MAG: hypothetical protein AAF735_03190 [Myxococcota bacterium]
MCGYRPSRSSIATWVVMVGVSAYAIPILAASDPASMDFSPPEVTSDPVTVGSSPSGRTGDEPVYEPDPFGDSDFGLDEERELVSRVRFPSRGRLEIGAMFANSVIDTYNSHLGILLDATYSPYRTLGFSVALGLNHGSTTGIIEEAFQEKLADCARDSVSDAACTLAPDVPDVEQITGSVDARAVWTPLYGKINVVSEVDANLEFYGFLGVGFHGQRQPEPTVDRSEALGWRVDGQGLGDGGLFSDVQWRGSAGIGFKVFVAEHVAFRTEAMGVGWIDDFDFVSGNESFPTYRYFLNTGLSYFWSPGETR